MLVNSKYIVWYNYSKYSAALYMVIGLSILVLLVLSIMFTSMLTSMLVLLTGVVSVVTLITFSALVALSEPSDSFLYSKTQVENMAQGKIISSHDDTYLIKIDKGVETGTTYRVNGDHKIVDDGKLNGFKLNKVFMCIYKLIVQTRSILYTF